MTRRRRTYGVKLVRGPFVRLPPHPAAVDDPDALPGLVADLEGPFAADLFCGAGGLSLGLTRAGYTVVLGVDHDVDALETHRAWHPGLSVDWDLAEEAVVERVASLVRELGIELVAGGPPCQPFSRAGRSMLRDLVRRGYRDHHDHRRDLWESFLGVVEMARPRAVVMENVPDMALDRGMMILRTMIERLEALGYTVDARVLDAWRFGVPQFRQRLILVALADGIGFLWPQGADERVSVANAIDDLPPVEGGWRPDNGDGPDPVATGWAPYAGPRTSFQRRAREGVPPGEADRVYDHITRPVRPDDAEAFARMDPGTRYSELPDELKRYRDDIFDDKYKRLDPDDVSRTITAHISKDGYWYIHPYQDRTLTIREAARLQTFPDWFRFAGPPSAAFRQIGNAVPPALAEHIGTAVRASLRRARPPRWRTGEVAAALAEWFAGDPPVAVPWLTAGHRWVVIQAETLWSRLVAGRVAAAWAAVRGLTTPAATLEAAPVLGRLARAWGREERWSQVRDMAGWFAEREDLLKPDRTAADLAAAPHLSQTVADLACRVVPGDGEDPVVVTAGVLRVAARFSGEPVDRTNSRTDGRIAVARMIGGGERSHEAHLALIELAARVCTPEAPECGRCPLVAWCAEAGTRAVQPTLTGG